MNERLTLQLNFGHIKYKDRVFYFSCTSNVILISFPEKWKAMLTIYLVQDLEQWRSRAVFGKNKSAHPDSGPGSVSLQRVRSGKLSPLDASVPSIGSEDWSCGCCCHLCPLQPSVWSWSWWDQDQPLCTVTVRFRLVTFPWPPHFGGQVSSFLMLSHFLAPMFSLCKLPSKPVGGVFTLQCLSSGI